VKITKFLDFFANNRFQ